MESAPLESAPLGSGSSPPSERRKKSPPCLPPGPCLREPPGISHRDLLLRHRACLLHPRQTDPGASRDLACSLSFVLLPLFSAERKTMGGKKEKPDPAGAVWVEEQKTAESGTKEPGAAKSRNRKRHRTKAGRWKEQTPAGSTEGRKESSQSSPAGGQSLPARQEGLYRRSLETAGAGCPSI